MFQYYYLNVSHTTIKKIKAIFCQYFTYNFALLAVFIGIFEKCFTDTSIYRLQGFILIASVFLYFNFFTTNFNVSSVFCLVFLVYSVYKIRKKVKNSTTSCSYFFLNETLFFIYYIILFIIYFYLFLYFLLIFLNFFFRFICNN